MTDPRLDAMREIIQQDVNGRGLARDPRDNLFTACRDDLAAACADIAGTAEPVLAVVTGFFIPHAQPPCGETDGPLGAVFLARALHPLGVRLVLVTDVFCHNALETGLWACGLAGRVPVVSLPDPRMRVAYHGYHWNPYPRLSHLIALERVGPGYEGFCRNMHGRNVTEYTAPAHVLFQGAHPYRPLPVTIGVGDGGNEIGMGKIPWEVIDRNIPNGRGIACSVPTDHLIVAGVSNWGAYALAAGVAVLRGVSLPASLFDTEAERELLRVMVENGPLVDGVTGRQTVTVDGLSFEEYARPLRRLGELLGAS